MHAGVTALKRLLAARTLTIFLVYSDALASVDYYVYRVTAVQIYTRRDLCVQTPVS